MCTPTRTGSLHVGRDAQRLAQVDPDRYEPNPKRRVDEPAVTLGDRRHSPAELLAAVLLAVAEAAVGAVGFLPPAVVTCPATWDADRRQVLADALALAGWPSAAEHTLSGPTPPGTRLLREPVAAARYYTEVLRRPVPVGDAVAVFDFGGGTLDVAVVRNEGADPWGDSGFTRGLLRRPRRPGRPGPRRGPASSCSARGSPPPHPASGRG